MKGAKMRQESGPRETAEKHVRDIRRATRRRHSAEDKIRIVLSGLRGEYSITELCRRDCGAETLAFRRVGITAMFGG
jgi:transposase